MDDLDKVERKHFAGLSVFILFLMISYARVKPMPVSFYILGFLGLAVGLWNITEIERRGKAITKFRNRPSRMREVLADLEHDQWVKLTKYYANQDDQIQVSDEKLNYWKDLWVDYEELSEEMKDKDRKYADKVIEALEEVDYY